MVESIQSKKRPTGIVIIAVLWTLVSIYNIHQALNGIITDLGYLPHLSGPQVPEWFSFGVPAEMMIGFFVLAYGFLTLLVVYGLVTAKTWSFDFALALPILIIVLNSATALLYYSAPSELGLREAGNSVAPFIFGNVIFLAFTWGYLLQPHVKRYLGKIPTPSPASVPMPSTQSAAPVPPPSEPIVTTEAKKFCRYCGEGNKTDAIFCEKCGRKIG